jgi:hypothetical protein
VTQEPLINLEVRFLLARYGRERVLEALANVGEVDPSQIEAAVTAYESRGKHFGKRSTADASALVEKLRLDPDTKAMVHELAVAYESGSFLPQLREVRRFLASNGIEGTVRSRRDALPRVVQALSKCGADHLRDLASRSDDSRRGDLGLIADQILGARRVEPEEPRNS